MSDPKKKKKKSRDCLGSIFKVWKKKLLTYNSYPAKTSSKNEGKIKTFSYILTLRVYHRKSCTARNVFKSPVSRRKLIPDGNLSIVRTVLKE